MAWQGEGSRMPGVPSMGAAGGCHHVSTASPSPLVTAPPEDCQQSPAGWGTEGTKERRGHSHAGSPGGPQEGISRFPPLPPPAEALGEKNELLGK